MASTNRNPEGYFDGFRFQYTMPAFMRAWPDPPPSRILPSCTSSNVWMSPSPPSRNRVHECIVCGMPFETPTSAEWRCKPCRLLPHPAGVIGDPRPPQLEAEGDGCVGTGSDDDEPPGSCGAPVDGRNGDELDGDELSCRSGTPTSSYRSPPSSPDSNANDPSQGMEVQKVEWRNPGQVPIDHGPQSWNPVTGQPSGPAEFQRKKKAMEREEQDMFANGPSGRSCDGWDWL